MECNLYFLPLLLLLLLLIINYYYFYNIVNAFYTDFLPLPIFFNFIIKRFFLHTHTHTFPFAPLLALYLYVRLCA